MHAEAVPCLSTRPTNDKQNAHTHTTQTRFESVFFSLSAEAYLLTHTQLARI